MFAHICMHVCPEPCRTEEQETLTPALTDDTNDAIKRQTATCHQSWLHRIFDNFWLWPNNTWPVNLTCYLTCQLTLFDWSVDQLDNPIQLPVATKIVAVSKCVLFSGIQTTVGLAINSNLTHRELQILGIHIRNYVLKWWLWWLMELPLHPQGVVLGDFFTTNNKFNKKMEFGLK